MGGLYGEGGGTNHFAGPKSWVGYTCDRIVLYRRSLRGGGAPRAIRDNPDVFSGNPGELATKKTQREGFFTES